MPFGLASSSLFSVRGDNLHRSLTPAANDLAAASVGAEAAQTGAEAGAAVADVDGPTTTELTERKVYRKGQKL